MHTSCTHTHTHDQLLWHHVDPMLALVSVVLNFNNRGRDPMNAGLLVLVAFLYRFVILPRWAPPS